MLSLDWDKPLSSIELAFTEPEPPITGAAKAPAVPIVVAPAPESFAVSAVARPDGGAPAPRKRRNLLTF